MRRVIAVASSILALCAMVLPSHAVTVQQRIVHVHATVTRVTTKPSADRGAMYQHVHYIGTVTTIPNSGSISAAAYDTLDHNYYLLGGELLFQLTPSGTLTQITDFYAYGFPAQVVWDARTALLYVSIPQSYEILSVTPSGTKSLLAGGTFGTNDGTGAAAQFQGPSGMSLDPMHHLLWVVDNDRLRTVSESGVVVTVGPTHQFGGGFGQSGGLWDAFDINTGDVAVADAGQEVVHLFHPPTAKYTVLAGRCILQFPSGCTPLHVDGRGSKAVFGALNGIAYDQASDAFYVADLTNFEVRKIDIHGNVSTLAGSGAQQTIDGVGLGASFSGPQCAGSNPVAHTLLVCDSGAFRIVTLTGTIAPPPQNAITMLPTATLVSMPSGIAATSDGSVWYAERGPSYLARMLPDGHQTEYVLPPKIGLPFDVAADSLGNVWFGDLGGFDQNGNPTKAYLAQLTPSGTIHESPMAFPCYPYSTGVYTDTLTPDASANMWFASCNGLLGYSTQAFKVTKYVTVGLNGLAMDPDGSVWGGNGSAVERFASDGTLLATYTTLRAESGVAWGPDGHVWFLSNGYGTIGNLNPVNGSVVVYSLPNCSCNRGVGNLTAGPDGALWFTEGFVFGSSSYAGGVGRVTTAGAYSEFRTFEPRSQPIAITFDSRGRLWLADFGADKIGRLKL